MLDPEPPGIPKTLRGVSEDGVETDCVVMTADDGNVYQLLGGDRAVLLSGAPGRGRGVDPEGSHDHLPAGHACTGADGTQDLAGLGPARGIVGHDGRGSDTVPAWPYGWSPTRPRTCPPTSIAATNLRVVPLSVTVSGEQGLEGVDISPADVAQALGERRHVVTTSRPAPAEFAEVYRELLAGGASGVVSVHLSARLSGTYESALLGAEEFGDRVRVVDSAAAGIGVGFVALQASAVPPRVAMSRRYGRRRWPRRNECRPCSMSTRLSSCVAAGGSAPPAHWWAPRCR